MENENINPEERLKQLNEERKTLREQVKTSKERRLEEAAKMRIIRDEKIEKIQEKLTLISSTIYKYNKFGKVEKDKCAILEMIRNLIESDSEVIADSQE